MVSVLSDSAYLCVVNRAPVCAEEFSQRAAFLEDLEFSEWAPVSKDGSVSPPVIIGLRVLVKFKDSQNSLSGFKLGYKFSQRHASCRPGSFMQVDNFLTYSANQDAECNLCPAGVWVCAFGCFCKRGSALEKDTRDYENQTHNFLLRILLAFMLLLLLPRLLLPPPPPPPSASSLLVLPPRPRPLSVQESSPRLIIARIVSNVRKELFAWKLAQAAVISARQGNLPRREGRRRLMPVNHFVGLAVFQKTG